MSAIFNVFIELVRSNRKKFLVILIVNLFIAVLGWSASQISFIKGHNELEILTSCIFNALIATFSFLGATWITASNQFTSQKVSLNALKGIAIDSDLVLYVSHLPRFSDWFKPEIIKYLISTSPSNCKTKDSLKAIRVFVLDDRHKHRFVGYWQSVCAKELIDIHSILGIDAVAMNIDEIETIASSTPDCKTGFQGYDFCIGFKKQPGSIQNILDIQPKDFVAFRVVLPDAGNFNEVTRFISFENPADITVKFYTSFANTLVGQLYDNNGKVKPDYLMDDM